MVNTTNISDYFHHTHHTENGGHCVHHCGGDHKAVNPKLDYEISHCSCGKHSVNKKKAIGHTINENMELVEINVEFSEKCPYGGWHIETGKIIK